jgi:hypothetical protein
MRPMAEAPGDRAGPTRAGPPAGRYSAAADDASAVSSPTASSTCSA